MEIRPTYNKHLFALAAVFVLGDCIIALPFLPSGDFALWGFVLAAALTVGIYFICTLFSCRIFKNEQSLLLKCLLIFAAVYAFYQAGLTFKRYMSFADEILLNDNNRFLIAFVFIYLTVFLLKGKKEALLKLGIVFFILSVITVLIFFLLSLKDFKIENIKVERLPQISELLKEAKPYFLSITLPSALLLFYPPLFTGTGHTRSLFYGVVTGTVLISVCMLDCLLLFGSPFSARLDFPLSAAVSTVTVGPLFSRMDGIVYALYFMTTLLKVSVCISISYKALQKAFK